MSESANHLVLLRQRLAETIQWCAIHGQVSEPKTSLRSPSLRPASLVTRGKDPIEYKWVSREGCESVVTDLCARRSDWLRQYRDVGFLPTVSPSSGRVLVWEVGCSLREGCPEDETSGFFDFDEAPPWDTWFAAIGESPFRPNRQPFGWPYILSWIPAEFVELADRGVRVSVCDCIWWADRIPRPGLLAGVSLDELVRGPE